MSVKRYSNTRDEHGDIYVTTAIHGEWVRFTDYDSREGELLASIDALTAQRDALEARVKELEALVTRVVLLDGIVKSIGRLIWDASDYFAKHGIEDPRRVAARERAEAAALSAPTPSTSTKEKKGE